MNKKFWKEKMLKNKLLYGTILGVASILVIELIIFISINSCNGTGKSQEKVKETVTEAVTEVVAGAQNEKEIDVVDKNKDMVGKVAAEETKKNLQVENRKQIGQNGAKEQKKDVTEDVKKNMTDKNGKDSCGEIDEDVNEYNIPVNKFDKTEGKIRNGDYFSTLMSRLGVSQNDIYELTLLSEGVFDMRQIKTGNAYYAYNTKEDPKSLAYLVYEKDNFSYVLFTLKDTLSVNVYAKEIKIEQKYTEVSIETSLWDAVINAGAPALLAIRLADNYAWSIDFFGLQKGDSFRALYNEKKYKGEVLDVENILFSEFIHDGKSYRSYYFDDGSGNYYWNEKGESMRKAFLKAPLSYTRISSGFSYARRHPITRKVSPHTGVDYAAPMGTEVMTIGDGTVIYVGRKAAEGKMIKIRHNSVYTTAYLHLSRFAKNLKTGNRVQQGEVIGYVGSTGRSTGPHLDFRIWKNGTPINPLKMESPPANPVGEKNMPAFRQCVETSEKHALRFYVKELIVNMRNALID